MKRGKACYSSYYFDILQIPWESVKNNSTFFMCTRCGFVLFCKDNISEHEQDCCAIKGKCNICFKKDVSSTHFMQHFRFARIVRQTFNKRSTAVAIQFTGKCIYCGAKRSPGLKHYCPSMRVFNCPIVSCYKSSTSLPLLFAHCASEHPETLLYTCMSCGKTVTDSAIPCCNEDSFLCLKCGFSTARSDLKHHGGCEFSLPYNARSIISELEFLVKPTCVPSQYKGFYNRLFNFEAVSTLCKLCLHELPEHHQDCYTLDKRHSHFGSSLERFFRKIFVTVSFRCGQCAERFTTVEALSITPHCFSQEVICQVSYTCKACCSVYYTLSRINSHVRDCRESNLQRRCRLCKVSVSHEVCSKCFDILKFKGIMDAVDTFKFSRILELLEKGIPDVPKYFTPDATPCTICNKWKVAPPSHHTTLVCENCLATGLEIYSSVRPLPPAVMCNHKAHPQLQCCLKCLLTGETGEEPVVCPICDLKYKDDNTMKVHVIVSHGLSKYQLIFKLLPLNCDLCDATFYNPRHLELHLTKKFRAAYICTLCGEAFPTSNQVEDHSASHFRNHSVKALSEVST